MKARGFSTVELLVVLAIVIVVAAIAVPGLLATRRTSDFETAVAEMRSSIELAVARAREGESITYSPSSALAAQPVSVTINSKFVAPPDGTEIAPVVVLQGGTGNPHVDGVQRGFAVVVSETDGEAIKGSAAIVVTSVGTVTRWDLDGRVWRVRK